MKLQLVQLFCVLVLAQTSFSESIFKNPDVSLKTSIGAYEVFRAKELGDVIIRTIEIKDGVNDKFILSFLYKNAGTGKIDRSALEFSSSEHPVRITVTSIDLTQSGRDNSAPHIKVTITQGETVQYKRVEFPSGYGIKKDQVISPEQFHMKWVLEQNYKPDKSLPALEFEMKLDKKQ